MPLKTLPWDTAEYLTDPESIAAYMTAALETNDPRFIVDALGIVARARGMSQAALDARVSSESLNQVLSADGASDFGAVLRVVQALGLKLIAEPAE